MSSFPHDPALIEHQDLVRIQYRIDSLCDNQDSRVRYFLLQRLSERGIRLEIQSRKTVVKNVQICLLHKCSRNGKSLFLTARKIRSALCHTGIQPIRQTTHKICLRHTKHPAHFLFIRLLIPLPQIFRDRPGEKPCLLRHIGDMASQFFLRDIPDIAAIYADRSFCGIMKPQEKFCDCRFSAPRTSDYCCRLPTPAHKIQAGQGIFVRIGKTERYIPKARCLRRRDIFFPTAPLFRYHARLLRYHAHLFWHRAHLFGTVHYFWLFLKHFFDPPDAHPCPRQKDDDHLCHNDIEKDQNRIFCQRRDISNLHNPRTDSVPSKPQNRNNAYINHEERRALKTCEQEIRADRSLRIIFKRSAHPLLLIALLAERADDAHSCQVLPEHHIHPVQQTLESAEDLRRSPGDKNCQHDDQHSHGNQQKSHHRINCKGHPYPHHTHGRHRENHLDTPDDGLLDDINIVQSPCNHRTCAELFKVVGGKSERLFIDRITHIPPESGRQIRTQPAPQKRSCSCKNRDSQHGDSSPDDIVHVFTLHTDIDHIRGQPGNQQSSSHIQKHGKNRKYAQLPVWF